MIDIKDILKLIDGNLSDSERQRVQSLIDSSPENQKEYHFYKKISEISKSTKDIIIPDIDAAWENFEKQTDIEAPKTYKTRNIWMYVSSIAASIMLAVATYFLFFNQKPLYEEVVTQNYNDTINLADGSKLFLKDNSKARYFTRITKELKERYVEIHGSAVFDIAHDDKLPFVVKANDAGIKVLGTQFKVDFEGEKVACENINGLVKLYEWVKPDNNLILHKGEKAVFDHGNLSMILPPAPPKPEKGSLKSVNQIIEYLFDHYVEKVNTAPYATIDMDDKIYIYLQQPLKGIMEQLDSNGVLKYRNNCPGCYEITVLKAKNDQ